MSCARLLPRVLRRMAEPRQGSAEARQSSISAHLDLSPLCDTPLSAHLGRVVTSDGGSMSDADEASEKSSYRKAPREGSWTVPGGVRGEREVVPRRSTRRRNAPSQSCTFFINHNSSFAAEERACAYVRASRRCSCPCPLTFQYVARPTSRAQGGRAPSSRPALCSGSSPTNSTPTAN